MQGLTKALIDGLVPAGPSDPIADYRRPLIGWLLRERINRGLALLEQPRYGRVLEVGFASGALLVLAPHADALHGIDAGADAEPMRRRLAARGHDAALQRGEVCDLPYGDGQFDLVVCFSVIERVAAFDRALAELRRVLAPNGQLLLGMAPAAGGGLGAIGLGAPQAVTAPEQVRRGFAPAGLRVVRAAFLDVPAGPPLGVRLYYDWLLEALR